MKIQEIAKICGVSVSTVSRVLNNKSDVSQKTKVKILEVIKNNDYLPNHAAISLTGKPSNIIGIFFKDLISGEEQVVGNSNFYTDFITTSIIEGQHKGYKILTSIVAENKIGRELKSLFNTNTISGAILLGFEEVDTEFFNQFNKKNKILVVNHLDEILIENIQIINTDDYKNSLNATQSLIDKGHRRIGHISGPEKRKGSQERMRGFLDCLKNNNIPVDTTLIEKGNFLFESGKQAILNIINSKPEYPIGLFISNDSMAIGAMEEIRKAELRIPEDISIVGYDDLEISKYQTPPLSTIYINFKCLAKKSIKEVVYMIEEDKKNKLELFEGKLVMRESVQ